MKKFKVCYAVFNEDGVDLNDFTEIFEAENKEEIQKQLEEKYGSLFHEIWKAKEI